ncbi:hypothetical protein GGQ68_002540 [Sagittula marina]|uniref:Uncharacterized protein n=1 Tax=Sagittula marina TaxID=943940 RepID=A0A7W6DSP4_9RHOB|nr:hypothetical protein [Sagittula marina]MBB3986202.1 hypothetical protein [Sagittula marina]
MNNTEEEGYRAGLVSGQRVPRDPDHFDAVHASNVGGPKYADGFLRGVTDAGKPKPK